MSKLLDGWTEIVVFADGTYQSMPANSPIRRPSDRVQLCGRGRTRRAVVHAAATVCFVSSTFIIASSVRRIEVFPNRDCFVTSNNTATIGSGLLTS